MGLAVMQGPICLKTLNAQETDSKSGTSAASVQETLNESYDSAQDENHKTGDLDKLLDNYQRETDQILQDYSALEEGIGGESNQFSDEDLETMEAAGVGSRQKDSISKAPLEGYRKNYFHALKKNKKGQVLTLEDRVSLALVPLQNLSDNDLRSFIQKSFKDSKVEELFNKYPSIVDKMIMIIRSDEVIPNFVKVIQDKDRLIYFVAAILCTFILSFLTKRIFYGPKSTFLGMCGGFILHSLFMMVVRLAVVYFFYKDELIPFVKIIYSTNLL